MKSYKFSFPALVFNTIMFILLTALFVPIVGPETVYVTGGIFALGLIPSTQSYYPVGSLRSELVRTVYSADLQKNLYPDDAFYKNSKVDSGVDINAKTVTVPNAGARPEVIKNPVTLPVPARVREDAVVTYDVDQYVTPIDVVTDVNMAVLTYDKRKAIMEDHINTLNQRIADELQILWAPTLAANIIRTTGTANTGTKIGAMSGNRKEILEADLIKICTYLDLMNVPDDGRRCLLVYTEQIAELKALPSIKDFDKSGIVGQFQTGAIGRIQNMNVYKRSVPLVYSSAPAKKAYGSAIISTDNLAILAWHPDFVRRAEGVAKAYYTKDAPGYQGDIFNTAVRGGGTISYLTQLGVVALVQA